MGQLREEFEKRLMPQIGMTMKALESFMSDYLLQEGAEITRVQWIVLMKLIDKDGISQYELACQANRDKAAMTRLISTLEKKNLVARIPSKTDKRINEIHITKHGRAMLNKQLPIMRNVNAKLEEKFSIEEKDVLISLLSKVRESVKELDNELIDNTKNNL